MNQKTNKKLNPHEARKLAVLAGVDPRTLLKYLSGLPVWSTTADRIETALHDHSARGGKP